MTDPLQSTTSKMQNNISMLLNILRGMARNNYSNFFNSREVVTVVVSTRLKSDEGLNICLLFRRLFTHNCISLEENSQNKIKSKERKKKHIPACREEQMD